MPAPGGFPDSGEGMFADKLSYKQWFNLNNANRVYRNFIESYLNLVVIILVSGNVYPKATLAIAAVQCVARPIYSIMYYISGGDYRRCGALLGGLPLYGLF